MYTRTPTRPSTPQAPAIPFTWDKTAIVQSKDVVGVANGYYTTHDLTFSSLKQ